MNDIIIGYAEFVPYIFMFCVVGIIWDKVVSSFMGRFR